MPPVFLAAAYVLIAAAAFATGPLRLLVGERSLFSLVDPSPRISLGIRHRRERLVAESGGSGWTARTRTPPVLSVANTLFPPARGTVIPLSAITLAGLSRENWNGTGSPFCGRSHFCSGQTVSGPLLWRPFRPSSDPSRNAKRRGSTWAAYASMQSFARLAVYSKPLLTGVNEGDRLVLDSSMPI